MLTFWQASEIILVVCFSRLG